MSHVYAEAKYPNLTGREASFLGKKCLIAEHQNNQCVVLFEHEHGFKYSTGAGYNEASKRTVYVNDLILGAL